MNSMYTKIPFCILFVESFTYCVLYSDKDDENKNLCLQLDQLVDLIKIPLPLLYIIERNSSFVKGIFTIHVNPQNLNTEVHMKLGENCVKIE